MIGNATFHHQAGPNDPHPWYDKPAGAAGEDLLPDLVPGMNCIKIGLSGKLIFSKRKGLREVLFS